MKELTQPSADTEALRAAGETGVCTWTHLQSAGFCTSAGLFPVGLLYGHLKCCVSVFGPLFSCDLVLSLRHSINGQNQCYPRGPHYGGFCVQELPHLRSDGVCIGMWEPGTVQPHRSKQLAHSVIYKLPSKHWRLPQLGLCFSVKQTYLSTLQALYQPPYSPKEVPSFCFP